MQIQATINAKFEKKNRIVQELKCTSLAINLNRESFSENLTLSSNEKFLKSF